VPFWSNAKRLKYFLSASFLSLLLGLIAFYYTLRGARTNLVVDVAAESNVLDVHAPVKQLAVLFQGQDIQQENANLKILVVRIANEGEVNILESYFDSRLPWGLEIEGGRAVEVRVTGSNSQYLAENLHPTVVGENRVLLEKIVFDRGKYVNLELLVLHSKNVEPKVKVIGKIAGMDDVIVSSSFREHDQQGLAKTVFKGPLPVQIARTIAYSMIGLAATVATGFLITGVVSVRSRFKKKSRRRLVHYLPAADPPEKDGRRQFLIDTYVEDGLEGLNGLLELLQHEKGLVTGPGDLLGLTRHQRAAALRGEYPSFVIGSTRAGLRRLLREGFIRIAGGTPEVDPEGLKLISSLISQLSRMEGRPEALERTESQPEAEPQEHEKPHAVT